MSLKSKGDVYSEPLLRKINTVFRDCAMEMFYTSMDRRRLEQMVASYETVLNKQITKIQRQTYELAFLRMLQSICKAQIEL